MSTKVRRRPDSGQPSAGERASERLLEAAGEVFAEKGYDRATAKEICERAGMNAASVNYHFDGIESLYTATLAHAHRQIVTIEVLQEIASSDASARHKLRAYIAPIVRRLASPAAASWEMRLLSREVLAPSPAKATFIQTELLPKKKLFGDIIAELIGVKPDDPVVGRAILTVVAPCLILAISDRATLSLMMPGIADSDADVELLIDHLERFIHAGLAAVAQHVQAEAGARPTRLASGTVPRTRKKP
ncbi:TetR/AcrR family transcriptional regulator [Paraburkholderia acidicola]|uniref:TetR/AcrR family transcriptional regulator n=1 Tax=Paraburkholderia acidicola TaxID=1912599 RepID=UPI000BBCC9EE|nr:CerR family C-terminal domain-containing protein [Paraburkholderia acidicola]